MPAAALLSTVTGLLSPRPPAANDQQEEEEQGERPPLTLPLVGAGPQESFASCASEWADARAEFEEGDAAATATAAAGKQQQPPAAMAAAAPAAAADDDDGDGHDGRVRPLPLPGAVPAVPDSPSSSPAPSLDGSEAGLNISPLPSTRQPPPPPSMETDVAAGVSPLSTDGWVVVAGDDDGDAASVGSALSFSTAMGEEEEEEEEREYVDRWGFVIRVRYLVGLFGVGWVVYVYIYMNVTMCV